MLWAASPRIRFAGHFGPEYALPLVQRGLCNDGFDRVQTGMNHLRAQRSGNTSSDQMHRGAMHQ